MKKKPNDLPSVTEKQKSSSFKNPKARKVIQGLVQVGQVCAFRIESNIKTNMQGLKSNVKGFKSKMAGLFSSDKRRGASVTNKLKEAIKLKDNSLEDNYFLSHNTLQKAKAAINKKYSLKSAIKTAEAKTPDEFKAVASVTEAPVEMSPYELSPENIKAKMTIAIEKNILYSEIKSMFFKELDNVNFNDIDIKNPQEFYTDMDHIFSHINNSIIDDKAVKLSNRNVPSSAWTIKAKKIASKLHDDFHEGFLYCSEEKSKKEKLVNVAKQILDGCGEKVFNISQRLNPVRSLQNNRVKENYLEIFKKVNNIALKELLMEKIKKINADIFIPLEEKATAITVANRMLEEMNEIFPEDESLTPALFKEYTKMLNFYSEECHELSLLNLSSEAFSKNQKQVGFNELVTVKDFNGANHKNKKNNLKTSEESPGVYTIELNTTPKSR